MKSLDISKYLEMSYSWPGNVRELNSALEYAFVIAESGRIGLEHLPPGSCVARRSLQGMPHWMRLRK
jgi:transcriptional regulator of acetoin/glycerol metabolism